YIPWNETTEVTDLLKLNIGLMPLENDPWCEGKCGFKIIQYLSLGIPAIASPVGVNKTIIENRVTGYLCNSENDWYKAIETLLLSEEMRSSLGKAGREKMIKEFSIQSQEEKFIGLFN